MDYRGENNYHLNIANSIIVKVQQHPIIPKNILLSFLYFPVFAKEGTISNAINITIHIIARYCISMLKETKNFLSTDNRVTFPNGRGIKIIANIIAVSPFFFSKGLLLVLHKKFINSINGMLKKIVI